MIGNNEWQLRMNGSTVGSLTVNFDNGTGTITYQGQTTSLTRFRPIGDDEFCAHFHAGRFSGTLVGHIAPSGVLSVDFSLHGGGKYSLLGKHMGEVMTPVAETACRFKGSYDLAGVALNLWRYDGVRSQPFVWSNDGLDLVNSCSNQNDLLGVRRMCCYEFVEYCGYLAGPQISPMYCDSAPGVLYSTGMDRAGRYQVWDWSSPIPRGKVVVGIAVGYNNNVGFYHTGISLGDGQIISLRSGENLSKDHIGGVFSRPYYSRVVYMDYPWKTRYTVPIELKLKPLVV